MTAPQMNSNAPQSHTESLTLHCGNNAEVLRQYPDAHFDVIVTDPPYGIEFLGKAWDSHTGAVETWQQCLRVLKPGGHLLAFSAARTYHNLATNIESVGFEIRDQLMWIYSSGFPKAQDIGKAIERRAGKRKRLDNVDIRPEYSHAVKGYCKKCNKSENGTNMKICQDTDCPYKDYIKPAQNQWAGWKTALKPGHEPIVMARKPFKGSTIDCVLTHGVGALNIDATRIPFDQQLSDWYSKYPEQKSKEGVYENYSAENRDHKDRPKVKRPTGGANGLSRLEFGEREPIKYRDQMKDHLAGMRRFTGSDSNTFARINPEDRDSKDHKRVIRAGRHPGARLGDLETQTTPADHNHEETPVYEANPQGRYPSNVLGDIPNYQKYFYCPKVSRRERHVGFEQDHLPKRLIPMPGENGLKDIRDCLDKDWANKKDPLAHLPTESSMLSDMGGYYVDAAGNRTETGGKNIWTPTTGMVYVHGLTKIYEAWLNTQQQDPLAHIPVINQGNTGNNGANIVSPTGEMNHSKASQRAVGNNHPTVKPVSLMRYLIQLVTPANSRVLDPFMGSGSTGMAAVELGHTFVGIDLDAAYVEIARKRITGWSQRAEHTPGNLDHIPTDRAGPPGENYAQRKQRLLSTPKPPIKNTDLFDDLFE